MRVLVPLLLGLVGHTPTPAIPPILRAAADSLLAINGNQADNDNWPDLSDGSRDRDARRIDRVKEMLGAIPAGQLSAPEASLLFENLREAVDASVGARVCRYELWAGVNQLAGWHAYASDAARVQPVGSAQARERALDLFRALPRQIAMERALLSRGLDSGYTASAEVIQTVIRQLDDLLPDEPTSSPLYAPATRDSTPEFRTAWRALLADVIYPAGKDYREFLRGDYLPRARREGSLLHQRDGAACYAAELRAQTSMQSDLDSLMRAARADASRITADLAPLVRELTGATDVADGIRQLRTDPRFTFSSRDSILPAYREMTEAAARRIGSVVAGFDAEPVSVVPYPEFQEKAGLPPMYIRAGNGAPAQFMVNLSRTERMSVADATAHEAYPGHHLQRIAELRAQLIHPVMRTLFFGGFVEGWGVYSEQLADEMGLYRTPLDRAGYLIHLLDVALAAYLDIGYHTRGWSRQDLVDSMMTLGGRAQRNAEVYADRHAATPGQLATYYVGFQAIRGYRARAAQQLGSAFQAPQFHREVLRDGTITLASLGSKLERWTRSQSPSRPTTSSARAGSNHLSAFTLAKVAEGVYVTVFPDPEGAGLNGNAVIIVNDADVLVVDTQDTPATTRAVIREIRRITRKPVRYVVNTHWHGDHHFGNQEYAAAYPGVEFIGHPATREDIVKEEIPGLATWIKTGLPGEITSLEQRLASGKTSTGLPLSVAQRASLDTAITNYRWLLKELGTVRMVLPTLTVADSLVLYRGSRTIEIRYLGRGNTRGDLTVYLPRERILAVGDLLVHPMPYGSESFPSDWVKVLERLREIPADAIIPGHGAVQHDRVYLDQVKALLESVIAQVGRAVANGLDLEATRTAVNLDSLRMRFTGGDPNLQRVFDANFTVPEIERAWKEARGELAQPGSPR